MELCFSAASRMSTLYHVTSSLAFIFFLVASTIATSSGIIWVQFSGKIPQQNWNDLQLQYMSMAIPWGLSLGPPGGAHAACVGDACNESACTLVTVISH